MSAAEFHKEANAVLSKLAASLPAAYSLTLIARHTTMAPEKNADMLITLDDPAAIIRAITRLMSAEATE